MAKRFMLQAILGIGLLTGHCELAFAAPIDSGPWAKLSVDLANDGIGAHIAYQGDIAANLSGGMRRGSAYTGNVGLQLTVNGSRAFGWPGITIFLNALDIHGGNPDNFVGDALGVDNIAARPQLSLYEAWMQYNTPDGRYSILAGRYDLNSEFYRLASAGLFLNSSFGIGPEFAFSGTDGPSIFPDTTLGLRLAYKPARNIVLRLAILDGKPIQRTQTPPFASAYGGGVLLVAEAAFLGRPGDGMAPGTSRSLIGRLSNLVPYDDKIAIGAWHYTARFDELDEVGRNGNPVRRKGGVGAYFLVDKLIATWPDGPGRLSAFFQAGIGDGRVDRFGSYYSLGLVATGAIPGRSSDQIGLSFASAINGNKYSDAQRSAGLDPTSSENAIELTYLAQISNHIAIQPDLQYVIHPDTDPRQNNALVAQVRLELSF